MLLTTHTYYITQDICTVQKIIT